jgi:hypothetical protein
MNGIFGNGMQMNGAATGLDETQGHALRVIGIELPR